MLQREVQLEDIALVRALDWSQPGQPAVTGVINLQPGRSMACEPLADEMPVRFTVEGRFSMAEVPAEDRTVTLHERTIDLPEAADPS